MISLKLFQLLSNVEWLKVKIADFTNYINEVRQLLNEKIGEINVKLDKVTSVLYDDNVQDVILKPSVEGHEILETIVANVLKDLGFLLQQMLYWYRLRVVVLSLMY